VSLCGRPRCCHNDEVWLCQLQRRLLPGRRACDAVQWLWRCVLGATVLVGDVGLAGVVEGGDGGYIGSPTKFRARGWVTAFQAPRSQACFPHDMTKFLAGEATQMC
jgi:hypothetical protein